MPSPRYVVPFKIDRVPGTEGRAKAKYQMGRGNAGWTTKSFATNEEAEAFARTVPKMAQMPCYENPARQTNPQFWRG